MVFLCGVGEGRIPLERKGLDTDEAEERRLLYVGMTRAREELVLLSGGEPSRFPGGAASPSGSGPRPGAASPRGATEPVQVKRVPDFTCGSG